MNDHDDFPDYEVEIVGIDIPFWDMVLLAWKWVGALLVAFFLPMLVLAIVALALST